MSIVDREILCVLTAVRNSFGFGEFSVSTKSISQNRH